MLSVFYLSFFYFGFTIGGFRFGIVCFCFCFSTIFSCVIGRTVFLLRLLLGACLAQLVLKRDEVGICRINCQAPVGISNSTGPVFLYVVCINR